MYAPTCDEAKEQIKHPFAQVTLEEWEGLAGHQKSGWLYHGQRCTNWTLRTSLDRFARARCISALQVRQVEKNISREFRRVYYRYAQHLPVDELEWSAAMQHHGAPTRLLDCTYSIFVAAYFALERATCDAAVWALDGQWLLDQSVVQLKGAGHQDAERLREKFDESHAPLIKSWFFGEHLARCAAPLNSFRLNQRLEVQRGVFLCQGDPGVSFEDNLIALAGHTDAAHVLQIRLPFSHSRQGLASLFNMNITRASLFPGLDGFAQSLGVYHSFLDNPWDAGTTDLAQ